MEYVTEYCEEKSHLKIPKQVLNGKICFTYNFVSLITYKTLRSWNVGKGVIAEDQKRLSYPLSFRYPFIHLSSGYIHVRPRGQKTRLCDSNCFPSLVHALSAIFGNMSPSFYLSIHLIFPQSLFYRVASENQTSCQSGILCYL